MKPSPAYAPFRICPPPDLRRHPRSIAEPSIWGQCADAPTALYFAKYLPIFSSKVRSGIASTRQWNPHKSLTAIILALQSSPRFLELG
jgi:hypothetical protein